MPSEPSPLPAAATPRKKRFRRAVFLAVLLSACLLFAAARFSAAFAEPSEIARIPRSAVEVLDSGSRGFFQSYEAFWLLKVNDAAAVKNALAGIEREPPVNETTDEFRAEANDFSERTVGRVFDGKTRHFRTNEAGWLWASFIVSEDGKFIYVHAVH